jgi:phosphatidylethanolamine/phosphatidyl-N-methylethanolamine N-methyltransferase
MAVPALARRMRKRIERKFGDEIRFFKGWLDRPMGVGSVVPTGDIASARMASVIDTTSGLPVLELGPGTGVITRAILKRGVRPDQLVSVEYSTDFAHALRLEFPGVHVIEGDAFALDETLGPFSDATFDCVISGLPLLSFKMAQRIALIDDLLSRVPPGRPVIQFSYGPRAPVPAGSRRSLRRFDYVLRNVPPAQLWIYSRPNA